MDTTTVLILVGLGVLLLGGGAASATPSAPTSSGNPLMDLLGSLGGPTSLPSVMPGGGIFGFAGGAGSMPSGGAPGVTPSGRQFVYNQFGGNWIYADTGQPLAGSDLAWVLASH